MNSILLIGILNSNCTRSWLRNWVSSQPRSICSQYLLGGDIRFFPVDSQWVCQPQSRSSRPTKNRLHVFLCACFLFCAVSFFLLVFFFFSLSLFFKKMLLYLFLFFEREKEYKKEIEHRAGWVERWRGSRKSWKVGETMIKICHLKTVKQKSENFSAVGFFNNILFYFC